MSMRRAMAEQSLPESDDEDSGCEGPAVMQQLAAFSAPPALQKQGSASGVGGPMRLAGRRRSAGRASPRRSSRREEVKRCRGEDDRHDHTTSLRSPPTRSGPASAYA